MNVPVFPHYLLDALYCHIWHVSLYSIFKLYRKYMAPFSKKIERKLCILIFSTRFV